MFVCCIAVGIAGATAIGNGVVLWDGEGIQNPIGDNAVIMVQSGVPASLEGNKIYFGSPKMPRLKTRTGMAETYPRNMGSYQHLK